MDLKIRGMCSEFYGELMAKGYSSDEAIVIIYYSMKIAYLTIETLSKLRNS